MPFMILSQKPRKSLRTGMVIGQVPGSSQLQVSHPHPVPLRAPHLYHQNPLSLCLSHELYGSYLCFEVLSCEGGGFSEAALPPHLLDANIFSRINSVFTNWDTPSIRISAILLIGCASLGKLLNLFEPPCPVCKWG